MNARHGFSAFWGIALVLSPLTLTGQDNTAGKNTTAPGAAETASAHNSLNLPFGARINVEISKDLDAKKLKPGDPIEARVIEAVKINGNTAIPRNSIVRGHVTEAATRSKKDRTTALGLVFDDVV